jgi:hypothetical protein
MDIQTDMGFRTGAQFIDVLRGMEVLRAVVARSELEGSNATDEQACFGLAAEGEPTGIGSIAIFLGHHVSVV